MCSIGTLRWGVVCVNGFAEWLCVCVRLFYVYLIFIGVGDLPDANTFGKVKYKPDRLADFGELALAAIHAGRRCGSSQAAGRR